MTYGSDSEPTPEIVEMRQLLATVSARVADAVTDCSALLQGVESTLEAERRKRSAIGDAARNHEAALHTLSSETAELRKKLAAEERAHRAKSEAVDELTEVVQRLDAEVVKWKKIANSETELFNRTALRLSALEKRMERRWWNRLKRAFCRRQRKT